MTAIIEFYCLLRILYDPFYFYTAGIHVIESIVVKKPTNWHVSKLLKAIIRYNIEQNWNNRKKITIDFGSVAFIEIKEPVKS